MAINSNSGNGGEGLDCGGAHSFGGHRTQWDPVGKLGPTPPPNPDGLYDLDSDSSAVEKCVLRTSSPMRRRQTRMLQRQRRLRRRLVRWGRKYPPSLHLHPGNPSAKTLGPEDPWSLYFQFPSNDAAKKYGLVKMYERDISYGSLLNVMENTTVPAWQQGGSFTSARTPRGARSTFALGGSSASTSARAAKSFGTSGGAGARRGARSFNPPRSPAEDSSSQPTGNSPKRTRYMISRMEGYFYASGNY
ncbi:hypothetical protein ZWY2020_059942 [Hordeum vulgare]|nr:hypothetical protein ZWY2020_059942 [Hordeum vulgare]